MSAQAAATPEDRPADRAWGAEEEPADLPSGAGAGPVFEAGALPLGVSEPVKESSEPTEPIPIETARDIPEREGRELASALKHFAWGGEWDDDAYMDEDESSGGYIRHVPRDVLDAHDLNDYEVVVLSTAVQDNEPHTVSALATRLVPQEVEVELPPELGGSERVTVEALESKLVSFVFGAVPAVPEEGADADMQIEVTSAIIGPHGGMPVNDDHMDVGTYPVTVRDAPLLELSEVRAITRAIQQVNAAEQSRPALALTERECTKLAAALERFVSSGEPYTNEYGESGYRRDLPRDVLDAQGLDYMVTVSTTEPYPEQPYVVSASARRQRAEDEEVKDIDFYFDMPGGEPRMECDSMLVKPYPDDSDGIGEGGPTIRPVDLNGPLLRLDEARALLRALRSANDTDNKR
jgi:hypothetical protein